MPTGCQSVSQSVLPDGLSAKRRQANNFSYDRVSLSNYNAPCGDWRGVHSDGTMAKRGSGAVSYWRNDVARPNQVNPYAAADARDSHLSMHAHATRMPMRLAESDDLLYKVMWRSSNPCSNRCPSSGLADPSSILTLSKHMAPSFICMSYACHVLQYAGCLKAATATLAALLALNHPCPACPCSSAPSPSSFSRPAMPT